MTRTLIALMFSASALAQMPKEVHLEPLMIPVGDGTPSIVVGIDATGKLWFVTRSWAKAPGGMFFEFDDRDDAGKWVSNAWINPGTLVGTPPYQGDIDLGVSVDGKGVVFGVAGRWPGSPPGVAFSQPDLMVFGNGQWSPASISATRVPCPSSVPGNPDHCIRVNGGLTPVYR